MNPEAPTWSSAPPVINTRQDRINDHPTTLPGTYVNSLGAERDARAYGAIRYERFAMVMADYDPTNTSA